MQDTSAAQARKGKDIQGIPWERLSITREKYRQTRLEQYKNYENIPQSGEGSEKVTILSPPGRFLLLWLLTLCIEFYLRDLTFVFYEKECKSTEKGALYYEFRRNSRSVKSTILHFQVSLLVTMQEI